MPLLSYPLGRERLWKAYWLLGLVGAVYFTIVRLATGVGAFPEPVGLTLEALYALYYAVSIWNCAFNVESPLWGYLARLTVVVGLVGMALEIYLTAQLS
jgi:hypothetical protein